MENNFEPSVQIVRSVEPYRYRISVISGNAYLNTTVSLNSTGFSSKNCRSNLVVVSTLYDNFYTVRWKSSLIGVVRISLVSNSPTIDSIIVFDLKADFAM